MATFEQGFHDLDQLALVAPSHAILNERASEVDANEVRTERFQALVDKMLDIARGQTIETSGMRLVGLAAPQVGVRKRLIIVDTVYTGTDPRGEESCLQPFVNPRITERSTETSVRREECYSTGNVRGLVERAVRIGISAQDRYGNDVSLVVEGFTARIFQHEIDHLDGIRFPERITNDAHLHWVKRKDLKRYRQNAEQWTDLCSREKWEAIKLGRDGI